MIVLVASGKTHPVKELLKSLGFRWAKDQKHWVRLCPGGDDEIEEIASAIRVDAAIPNAVVQLASAPQHDYPWLKPSRPSKAAGVAREAAQVTRSVPAGVSPAKLAEPVDFVSALAALPLAALPLAALPSIETIGRAPSIESKQDLDRGARVRDRAEIATKLAAARFKLAAALAEIDELTNALLAS